MLPEVLQNILPEVLHQKEGRRRKARKGEEGKRRQVAGIQKKGEKCSEEEGLGMDRAEREMVLEKGQQTASYPESNLHILSEVLTEVLPEASSSLSSYEKLIHPRLLDTNGIIEDSQRQESSSHEASPPSSFVPEGSTSAETGGKAQEVISQEVQEGEALETMLEEVQQGGETSTELLQLGAEISPSRGS